MELKLFLKLVWEKKKLFLSVLVGPVILVWIYLFFLPATYNVSLNLHITRQGTDAAQEYQYDDFYRLQADEKFADTLVEWLKNPRMVADIYKIAGIDTDVMSLRALKNAFSPEKKSSQLVVVNFSVKDPQQGEKLSQALVQKVSESVARLNGEQNQNNWFVVMAEAPLIILFRWSKIFVTLAALVVGSGLAIFAVLFKHYFED